MVDSCVIFLPNINQRNPKKGEKTVNKEPSNTNHKLGKTKLCFAAVLSFLNKMEPIITSNPWSTKIKMKKNIQVQKKVHSLKYVPYYSCLSHDIQFTTNETRTLGELMSHCCQIKKRNDTKTKRQTKWRQKLHTVPYKEEKAN